MTNRSPRIVLFHATSIAMMPSQEAMERLWPQAEAVNLLDDGLSLDRAEEGDAISEDLIQRFVALGRYAHERVGAEGILVTCSAFGPAIDRMTDALPIPIVKPNEAMFREAIAAGGRIGMVATFQPAVSSMTSEFNNFVKNAGTTASLHTILADGALGALRNGDVEMHNRLVAERAVELRDYDAVMLAHFSTSRAREAVQAKLKIRVLSAPDAAVARMRALIDESASC
jgi:Asp/Glu/hydantoin racemase